MHIFILKLLKGPVQNITKHQGRNNLTKNTQPFTIPKLTQDGAVSVMKVKY